MARVNVGIVGVTGYTGQELLRLLLAHPRVRITYLASSGRTDPQPAVRHFGLLPVPVTAFDPAACTRSCHAAFLCLPHAASMEAAPALLARRLKVVDLSAAYRLKSAQLYERYYGFAHAERGWLAKAVYGLPELHRAALKRAKLIAAPGCYPTGAILALAPLLRSGLLRGRIVVDAKSGATGAGREAKPELVHGAVNENTRAYGVFTHRHEPEIAQELSGAARKAVAFSFTPHLLPMNRGILTTAHLELKAARSREALVALYRKSYSGEPFVRVLAESLPDTAGVKGTNFCDIGVAVRGKEAVVVSVIDNLVKGAAGQAVQGFNLQHGVPETTGLLALAGAP